MNRRNIFLTCLSLALVLALTGLTRLAAAAEVPLDKVKRIPPPGVKVPPADREELEAGVAELAKQIEVLRHAAVPSDLIPDVQIFYNAVHYALKYDEFFNTNDIAKAKVLVNEGLHRANELRDGEPSWPKMAGWSSAGMCQKSMDPCSHTGW